MGDVVSFSAAAKKKVYRSCEELAQLDTTGLDKIQLNELLETVKETLRRLDSMEPADMDSDAYAEWADIHEQVEDLQDEILDELD